MARPAVSLSLDMDNAWAYLKTHCDPAWETYPNYLPKFVPIALEFLARHNQKVTFMIVGQDAVREENQAILQEIVAAGHEVGNHSFNHETWMQTYGDDQVVEEIIRTEQAIVKATGSKPAGFRGPGYAASETILNVLQRLGYRYDSSLLPSILNPIARVYYIWGTKMSQDEKKQRGDLFGHFRDGFASLKPFHWKTATGHLLEIPITTIPCLRLPFHLSYLLWLSRFSRSFAFLYFRVGLLMCHLRGVRPCCLMHPLDFLGVEDAPELRFFPGMDLAREYKLQFAGQFLRELQRHFEVMPIGRYLSRIPEISALEKVATAHLRSGRLLAQEKVNPAS